jgi:predicted O-methyltransferase YrrM
MNTNVAGAFGAPFSQLLGRFGAMPYAVTIFLSAMLVFLVQPMFAKMATPLLGGAPNVWNVSLVCFQAALLLGYAYAHALNHCIRSARTQVILHGAMLLLAAIVLPLGLTDALGAPDANRPALWLMGVFALSIAPPFAIISASAPLVQSWYARSGRDDAGDPYFLYAASNVGSLIGLAGYPLLMEPTTALAMQGIVWTFGYAALAVLLVSCGALTAITGTPRPAAAPSERISQRSAAAWLERLRWIALAFVPSSLLVGVTSHITTDLASAPFLWVLPLMAFLVTFIIVFSRKPAISAATSQRLVPIAVAAALIAIPHFVNIPMALNLFVQIAGFFLIALACHGRLADERPEPSRLTEFYLLMSVGGVLGGAFNALIVPTIFNGVWEYPLVLALALALRGGAVWKVEGRDRIWALGSLIVIAMVGVFHTALGLTLNDKNTAMIYLGVAALCMVMGSATRTVPILGAIAIIATTVVVDPYQGRVQERSFFGVLRIGDLQNYRVMHHGTTIHGAQRIEGNERLVPLTYYAPPTPIGQVFRASVGPRRVGAVGLGAGSVACYMGEGDVITYYEIDPLVAKYASDPAQYTFLSSCTPNAPIIIGDGRLSVQASAPGTYDLLLIDAFSSDSIPAHMLTAEAIALYLDRMTDDGVLVVHLSNRHMALINVAARIAETLGVPARVQMYRPANDMKDFSAIASDVVVFAKTEAAFDRFDLNGQAWQVLKSDGKRAWTDDYSFIVGAIIEKYRGYHVMN